MDRTTRARCESRRLWFQTPAGPLYACNGGDTLDSYNPFGFICTESPQPGNWLPAVGDIVVFAAGATPLGAGHTAVVVAISTSCNTFTVLSQNWFGPADGERIAAEQTWYVGPQCGVGMAALDGAGNNPTRWLNLAPTPTVVA